MGIMVFSRPARITAPTTDETAPHERADSITKTDPVSPDSAGFIRKVVAQRSFISRIGFTSCRIPASPCLLVSKLRV